MRLTPSAVQTRSHKDVPNATATNREAFVELMETPAVSARISAGHRITAFFLAVLLVFGAIPSDARTPPTSFADLAEDLLPAVVNISTTQVIEGRPGVEMPQVPPGSPFEEFFKEFFERNRPQQQQRRATSLGSGFFIDKAGYVVTNNHVIQDADEITVVLHDDTRLEAEVVGRDPKTDLAVLKVDPPAGLTSVEWGDSDDSRVGDWVIAIGNPFGLGGTVTTGIISARGRDINAGPYDDFLQTDASINRGNSGGPMFNLDGSVIGVNTAIFSPSGGSIGIGFAIPSNSAKAVVNQLIEHGKMRRGWLGVHIQAVTDEIAETLGLEDPEGALVASVIEDGPAEKAGIKNGDVILEFDGKRVDEMRRLPRIVADTEVGKTVDVRVWRDGRATEVEVEIGALEDGEKQFAARGEGRRDPSNAVEVLGLTLAGIDDKLRERFNLDGDTQGVVVTAVDASGAAAEKGVRPGDVVVEVSQDEVSTPGEVAAKIGEAREAGRRSVLFLLEGQGGLRFVALRIDKG